MTDEELEEYYRNTYGDVYTPPTSFATTFGPVGEAGHLSYHGGYTAFGTSGDPSSSSQPSPMSGSYNPFELHESKPSPVSSFEVQDPDGFAYVNFNRGGSRSRRNSGTSTASVSFEHVTHTSQFPPIPPSSTSHLDHLSSSFQNLGLHSTSALHTLGVGTSVSAPSTFSFSTPHVTYPQVNPSSHHGALLGGMPPFNTVPSIYPHFTQPLPSGTAVMGIPLTTPGHSQPPYTTFQTQGFSSSAYGLSSPYPWGTSTQGFPSAALRVPISPPWATHAATMPIPSQPIPTFGSTLHTHRMPGGHSGAHSQVYSTPPSYPPYPSLSTTTPVATAKNAFTDKTRFNGSNFTTWSNFMQQVLESQGLWDLVVGTEPLPDPRLAHPEHIRQWRARNATANVELMQGLLPEFHSQLQHFPLASERWSHLLDRYAARDRTRRINLDFELQEFSIKEGDDLKVKLAEYRWLLAKFATTGSPKSDDDQVTFFLNKLPEKYFHFIQHIISLPRLPTFYEFECQFLRYARLHDQVHKKSSSSPYSEQRGLVASSSGGKTNSGKNSQDAKANQNKGDTPSSDGTKESRPLWQQIPKKNRFCTHCQRAGHVDEECRSKAQGFPPKKPPQTAATTSTPAGQSSVATPPAAAPSAPSAPVAAGHVARGQPQQPISFTSPEGLADWSASDSHIALYASIPRASTAPSRTTSPPRRARW